MKRLFIFAAVLPLLLTSCDKEKLDDATDNIPVPLSIQATIDISSGSTSRSLVRGDTLPGSSEIGIFVTGTGYTPQVSIYTLEGSEWTTPNPIYLTKNEATVYGFYPTIEPSDSVSIRANTTDKTIPITVASSYNAIASDVPATQADYLYAKGASEGSTMAKVTKSNPNASLKFYHALSQLSFIINKADNFGGTGNLTSLTVTTTSDNITGAGTLKLDGSGITLSGSLSKSITMTGSTTINASSSTVVTATALVAPLTSSQSVTLTMTIDGQNYTGTISGATWEAGKNYIYTVTVGGGTLTITSVSIQGWVDVGSGNVIVD
jgi:hypothetical protein